MPAVTGSIKSRKVIVQGTNNITLGENESSAFTLKMNDDDVMTVQPSTKNVGFESDVEVKGNSLKIKDVDMNVSSDGLYTMSIDGSDVMKTDSDNNLIISEKVIIGEEQVITLDEPSRMSPIVLNGNRMTIKNAISFPEIPSNYNLTPDTTITQTNEVALEEPFGIGILGTTVDGENVYALNVPVPLDAVPSNSSYIRKKVYLYPATGGKYENQDIDFQLGTFYRLGDVDPNLPDINPQASIDNVRPIAFRKTTISIESSIACSFDVDILVSCEFDFDFVDVKIGNTILKTIPGTPSDVDYIRHVIPVKLLSQEVLTIDYSKDATGSIKLDTVFFKIINMELISPEPTINLMLDGIKFQLEENKHVTIQNVKKVVFDSFPAALQGFRLNYTIDKQNSTIINNEIRSDILDLKGTKVEHREENALFPHGRFSKTVEFYSTAEYPGAVSDNRTVFGEFLRYPDSLVEKFKVEDAVFDCKTYIRKIIVDDITLDFQFGAFMEITDSSTGETTTQAQNVFDEGTITPNGAGDTVFFKGSIYNFEKFPYIGVKVTKGSEEVDVSFDEKTGYDMDFDIAFAFSTVNVKILYDTVIVDGQSKEFQLKESTWFKTLDLGIAGLPFSANTRHVQMISIDYENENFKLFAFSQDSAKSYPGDYDAATENNAEANFGFRLPWGAGNYSNQPGGKTEKIVSYDKTTLEEVEYVSKSGFLDYGQDTDLPDNLKISNPAHQFDYIIYNGHLQIIPALSKVVPIQIDNRNGVFTSDLYTHEYKFNEHTYNSFKPEIYEAVINKYIKNSMKFGLITPQNDYPLYSGVPYKLTNGVYSTENFLDTKAMNFISSTTPTPENYDLVLDSSWFFTHINQSLKFPLFIKLEMNNQTLVKIHVVITRSIFVNPLVNIYPVYYSSTGRLRKNCAIFNESTSELSLFLDDYYTQYRSMPHIYIGKAGDYTQKVYDTQRLSTLGFQNSTIKFDGIYANLIPVKYNNGTYVKASFSQMEGLVNKKGTVVRINASSTAPIKEHAEEHANFITNFKSLEEELNFRIIWFDWSERHANFVRFGMTAAAGNVQLTTISELGTSGISHQGVASQNLGSSVSISSGINRLLKNFGGTNAFANLFAVPTTVYLDTITGLPSKRSHSLQTSITGIHELAYVSQYNNVGYILTENFTPFGSEAEAVFTELHPTTSTGNVYLYSRKYDFATYHNKLLDGTSFIESLGTNSKRYEWANLFTYMSNFDVIEDSTLVPLFYKEYCNTFIDKISLKLNDGTHVSQLPSDMVDTDVKQYFFYPLVDNIEKYKEENPEFTPLNFIRYALKRTLSVRNDDLEDTYLEQLYEFIVIASYLGMNKSYAQENGIHSLYAYPEWFAQHIWRGTRAKQHEVFINKYVKECVDFALSDAPDFSEISLSSVQNQTNSVAQEALSNPFEVLWNPSQKTQFEILYPDMTHSYTIGDMNPCSSLDFRPVDKFGNIVRSFELELLSGEVVVYVMAYNGVTFAKTIDNFTFGGTTGKAPYHERINKPSIVTINGPTTGDYFVVIINTNASLSGDTMFGEQLSIGAKSTIGMKTNITPLSGITNVRYYLATPTITTAIQTNFMPHIRSFSQTNIPTGPKTIDIDLNTSFPASIPFFLGDSLEVVSNLNITYKNKEANFFGKNFNYREDSEGNLESWFSVGAVYEDPPDDDSTTTVTIKSRMKCEYVLYIAVHTEENYDIVTVRKNNEVIFQDSGYQTNDYSGGDIKYKYSSPLTFKNGDGYLGTISSSDTITISFVKDGSGRPIFDNFKFKIEELNTLEPYTNITDTSNYYIDKSSINYNNVQFFDSNLESNYGKVSVDSGYGRIVDTSDFAEINQDLIELVLLIDAENNNNYQNIVSFDSIFASFEPNDSGDNYLKNRAVVAVKPVSMTNLIEMCQTYGVRLIINISDADAVDTISPDSNLSIPIMNVNMSIGNNLIQQLLVNRVLIKHIDIYQLTNFVFKIGEELEDVSTNGGTNNLNQINYTNIEFGTIDLPEKYGKISGTKLYDTATNPIGNNERRLKEIVNFVDGDGEPLLGDSAGFDTYLGDKLLKLKDKIPLIQRSNSVEEQTVINNAYDAGCPFVLFYSDQANTVLTFESGTTLDNTITQPLNEPITDERTLYGFFFMSIESTDGTKIYPKNSTGEGAYKWQFPRTYYFMGTAEPDYRYDGSDKALPGNNSTTVIKLTALATGKIRIVINVNTEPDSDYVSFELNGTTIPEPFNNEMQLSGETATIFEDFVITKDDVFSIKYVKSNLYDYGLDTVFFYISEFSVTETAQINLETPLIVRATDPTNVPMGAYMLPKDYGVSLSNLIKEKNIVGRFIDTFDYSIREIVDNSASESSLHRKHAPIKKFGKKNIKSLNFL